MKFVNAGARSIGVERLLCGVASLRARPIGRLDRGLVHDAGLPTDERRVLPAQGPLANHAVRAVGALRPSGQRPAIQTCHGRGGARCPGRNAPVPPAIPWWSRAWTKRAAARGRRSGGRRPRRASRQPAGARRHGRPSTSATIFGLEVRLTSLDNGVGHTSRPRCSRWLLAEAFARRRRYVATRRSVAAASAREPTPGWLATKRSRRSAFVLARRSLYVTTWR